MGTHRGLHRAPGRSRPQRPTAAACAGRMGWDGATTGRVQIRVAGAACSSAKPAQRSAALRDGRLVGLRVSSMYYVLQHGVTVLQHGVNVLQHALHHA